MNKKRLGDLVRVLRGVPRKNLDMRGWQWESLECGTVMCAAGHYMKTFPRRELRPDGCGIPILDAQCGVEALSAHFDITHDDAKAMFLPNDNPTPKQVARRFEKYMKTGEVPA